MNAEEILRELMDGNLSLKEAERLLRMNAIDEVGTISKIDTGRASRRGIPEIVLAEGKLPDHVVKIAKKMLQSSDIVIISRLAREHERALKKAMGNAKIKRNELAKTMVISKRVSESEGRRSDLQKKRSGKVAIMTAGTADIPVAEEAKVVLEEAGCKVFTAYDVGVAGIHRLFSSMRSIVKADVDVIVAVAGREGAMPSIIAGLVDVPVIGVPTSFSYGFGARGTAALMSMLQACSLGIATVNIDSGIAAGVVAALIARRSSRK